MDRLIAPYTVSAAAADVAPATGTPGFATNGNPATNTPATQWPAYQFNSIQEELIAIITAGQVTPDRTKNNQVLAAIMALIKGTTLPAMTFAQANALTANQGPIYVSDRHHIANFSTSAFYTGYRSDHCGDWHIGSMSSPRLDEIAGIGGIFNIADYPSLWGWANEMGFVVPAASWVPSATNYSLIGTTQFRVPDYRNMFPRVEGTDVDTANPRLVGTAQTSMFPAHSHDVWITSRYGTAVAAAGDVSGIDAGGPTQNYTTGISGSGTDQRPANTAVSAVICV